MYKNKNIAGGGDDYVDEGSDTTGGFNDEIIDIYGVSDDDPNEDGGEDSYDDSVGGSGIDKDNIFGNDNDDNEEEEETAADENVHKIRLKQTVILIFRYKKKCSR